MASPDNYVHVIAENVQKLLYNTRVAQTDFIVEQYPKSPNLGTVYKNNGQHPEEDTRSEADPIYAIGSLTKLLVAVLLIIIVDRLSFSKGDDEQAKRYRKLRFKGRDPWDTSFTVLFNDFSDQMMEPFPQKTSLRHVLIHFNSLPAMNFMLLGPCGKSLMSVREFIETAPRLARAAYETFGADYLDYSNGNYILIGLLIKAIVPDSTLQELMSKYIFSPLKMTRTFMDNTALAANNVRHTQSFVVSTSGIPVLADNPGYSSLDIVAPAMAAWSCTKDLAALLREFFKILIDGENSILTKTSLLRLLQYDGILVAANPEGTRQSPCGFYDKLNSLMPGRMSINRAATRENECSTYRLGLHKNSEIESYYMAGAVNGYSSCLYFIPNRKMFVIVLTNTTGFVDASDHISRYILQDFLILKRPVTMSRHPKVDILKMSLTAAQEFDKILNEWRREDTEGDAPNLMPLQLYGTYRNELTGQLIEIRLHDNQLIVKIRAAEVASRDIGLYRTGNLKFRLYPLGTDIFVLDRYDPWGWKDLTFDVIADEDGNGNKRAALIRRQGIIPVSLREFRRI